MEASRESNLVNDNDYFHWMEMYFYWRHLFILSPHGFVHSLLLCKIWLSPLVNYIYCIRPTHRTLQELLWYWKRMLRVLLWLEDWPQSVLPHAFPRAKATSVQEMTSLRSTVFWDVVLMPWSFSESHRTRVDNHTVLFHWLRSQSIPHPVQMQDKCSHLRFQSGRDKGWGS